MDELRELFEHARAGFVELVGRGRDVDGEVTRRDALGVVGAHRVGEAAPVAQLEEQPAALAGEQLRDHLEREAIGIRDRHAAKADHEVRLRAVLAQLGLADLARRLFGRRAGCDEITGRNRREPR